MQPNYDEKRIAFTRSGLNRVRSRSYSERNVTFCLNYNLKEVLNDHKFTCFLRR